MYTREDLIKQLKPYLLNNPDITTIWEGGSAATNTVDAYSDLDLMIVTEKANIESLFIAIESFLNKHFGIDEKFRVPEPAWHGFSQCFYHLETTEPWVYIDLCILPTTIKDRFTAIDRHGEITAWKDTIQFIENIPTPQKDIKQKAKRFYQNATSGEFVLRLEIDKAVRRENYIDAYNFMYAYLMRHLIPLMNIEHRIEKVDFGMRYAKRDYSASDYTVIQSFFKASSINELEKVFKLILSRFESLKTKYIDYA